VVAKVTEDEAVGHLADEARGNLGLLAAAAEQVRSARACDSAITVRARALLRRASSESDVAPVILRSL
jgi:hypothetical protein